MAANLLNGLASEFDLKTHQTEEIDRLEELIDLLQDVHTSDRSLVQLNGEELDVLENLINSADGEMTYATQLAQNLLKAGGRNRFFHVYLPEETPEMRTAGSQNPWLLHQQGQTGLKVYPSPADAYATVEFQLPAETIEAILSVFSIQGQQLYQLKLKTKTGQELLDTRHFPAGLYVVELKADGQLLKREKMVVNH